MHALLDAARTKPFWLLAGSFAICGATTNGLIATHFIPAAHDHGMPITVAASLLAVVGVFDVCGTIVSGWLTDRFDPRLLLVGYYLGRGLSLMALPSLLAPHTQPEHDGSSSCSTGWTGSRRCRPRSRCAGSTSATGAPVVFGWVFASHQIGAAIAASGAGYIRDVNGNYDLAFYLGAGLCAFAAAICAAIGARRRPLAPTLS